METEKKYINPFNYIENTYWSVDVVRELAQHFRKMDPIWRSGLDKPSIADILAYEVFNGAIKSIVKS